jgi:FMN-dependent oxidoreductase (nitrilotriacetate monooxygenase family)
MGMATQRLGLGATYSTTYYEPFHVARVFATLDLMTEGRAAWNVVTSLNDGEAQNMGRDEALDHDLRYERADEFMEVVLGHWDAWEDDAIVQDKASGLFARPDKVHRLDYAGRFFRSRGPFTVPRSPQGHPVIIQAGSSGRGKRFGAQWGEIIFVVYPNLETGKRDYAGFKAEVARLGRYPDHVTMAQLVNTVAAATKSEAEDKWAAIEKLPLEIDALSLLSEALNFDFATKGMDEAFTDAELAGMSGLQGIRDRVLSVKKTRRYAISSPSADGAGCTTRLSEARRRSPTISNNGSWSAAATASCCQPPTCRGPTRISSPTSCLSCSAAVCSARTSPAPRYATISVCRSHRPVNGAPARRSPRPSPARCRAPPAPGGRRSRTAPTPS